MKASGMRHGRTLLALALAFGSCTPETERLTVEQQKVVEEYVDSVEPSPRFPLDVVFDQRLRLLGYDVDRTEWRPGEPLDVTWYWEVLAPPQAETQVWTEIEAPGASSSSPIVGASPLRDVYGPERWRAGQFVRDRQTLVLPNDWTAPSATVRVAVAVGDDAAVKSSPVSLSTPRARTTSNRTSPTLEAIRTKTTPRLDGTLSDSVWSFANWTTPFEANVPGGGEMTARAKVLWDSHYLYVAVDVRDAIFSNDDAARCETGCVVVAFAPPGQAGRVVEIQVSPRGTVFDERHELIGDERRKSEWSSRARAAVRASGSTPGSSHTVELAIPWQAFSPNGDVFPPPRAGDRWRFNAAVVSERQRGRNSLTWSPVGADDFHVPERFGILRFEGAPERMQGSSTPTELPEGRMPAPMRRSVDPSVRDSLLERNAVEKNRIDAVREKSLEPQRLEPSEGGR